MILLGTCSALRETDAISSFERTFGIPPILSGDFWGHAETPNEDFLADFQNAIQPSTKPNRTETPSVPGDLYTCKLSSSVWAD